MCQVCAWHLPGMFNVKNSCICCPLRAWHVHTMDSTCACMCPVYARYAPVCGCCVSTMRPQCTCYVLYNYPL